MKNLTLITSLLLIIGVALMFSLALETNFIATAAVLFLLSFIPQGSRYVLKTVVSNPLIGRSKQSMGGVTFSSWKGINVLKNKATSVANPRTGTQLAQRAAFSQMVQLFRQMPSAIKAGFKKQAVQKSEFNAFASSNLDNAWDMSAPPDATLIPANVQVSKGTIAQTAIATAVADRSLNTIVITFSATVDFPGQSLADFPIVTAINPSSTEPNIIATGNALSSLRSTGTATIPLPAIWNTGDSITMYLGFYNELSGESSDSVNSTSAIVA
jgi:Family of unknown function (DUF6266)